MGNRMMKLKKATTMALNHYMSLDESETCLVLTDEADSEIKDIALAFHESAVKKGREGFYMVMTERKLNGEEPPEFIVDVMREVDVVVAVTKKSLANTAAVFKAARIGSRIAILPEMNAETLIRTINVDYRKTVALTSKVAEVLDGAKKIRMTSPLGTDIEFNIEGRRINEMNGMLNNLTSFGHMPGGEVSVTPIEDQTNGVIVLDSSGSLIGKIENPVTIEIENGIAVKTSGLGGEARIFARYLHKGGAEAKTLSEVGFGTNHRAMLTGNIIEDMKMPGVVHIGFGNNLSLFGKIYVPMHNDGTIKSATVWVDDQMLIENGQLLVK
jgi:leucyl aminopeptidase (aminopeptidase T)